MRKTGWIVCAVAVVVAGIVYLRPLGAQQPSAGGPGLPPPPGGAPGGMGAAPAPPAGQPGGAPKAGAQDKKPSDEKEDTGSPIREKTQEPRQVDLTPILSALGATGSYGRPRAALGARPVPVGRFVNHYLVPDRLLIRGGIWKVGIIETGTRYHRFSCPLMLAADPGKIVGFANWQDAVAAGYTADSVCNPTPVAEVLALAREITRGGPVELDPRGVQMLREVLPPELIEILQRAADKAGQSQLFAPRPQGAEGGMMGGEGMGGGMMGGGAMGGAMGGGMMPGMPSGGGMPGMGGMPSPAGAGMSGMVGMGGGSGG